MATRDVGDGSACRHGRDVADAARGSAVSVVARRRAEVQARAVPARRTLHDHPAWRSPALVLPGAALALILAMFAPLMRGGVVLRLDTPVNLVGPYPRTSVAVGGAPPELAARAPLDALLASLYGGLPWGQARLLPLVAAVGLAAWGFARLFPRRRLAAFGATLLFVTNPFMYERIVAGQDFLVLGFYLLPILLSLLWAQRSRRAILATAGLLVAIAALALHLVLITGVLCSAYVTAHAVRRRWHEARALVFACGLAMVGSLYWIVPAVSSWDRIDQVPVTDLSLFRSTPDPQLGLWPNLAGLYGFWRHGWPLPKDGLAWWPLFLIAILLVMAVGLSGALRDVERRRRLLPLLIVGSIGLVLAAGDQGIAGGGYAWAFDHLPVFRIMREPQKWLVLLALAYAVAFGEGLEQIVRSARRLRARVVAAVVVLAIPAVYGFSSFWGSAGYVRPSHYPASWAQADARMGEGPGLVVALPWHRYLPLPWTQDRVVSNPMVSAFRRDVVVSGDPEFGGLPAEGRDPLADRVGAVLDRGTRGQHVAGDLLRLGVRYLVLEKVGDWENFAWLFDQDGIAAVHRWNDLVLFQVGSTG
jgi:hypothetical protein